MKVWMWITKLKDNKRKHGGCEAKYLCVFEMKKVHIWSVLSPLKSKVAKWESGENRFVDIQMGHFWWFSNTVQCVRLFL